MTRTNKPLKTEWAKCRQCGQDILRDIFRGKCPGPWWHDMPGQDFKHTPEPVRPGLLARLVGRWVGA